MEVVDRIWPQNSYQKKADREIPVVPIEVGSP
jgi:hypothetical protein